MNQENFHRHDCQDQEHDDAHDAARHAESHPDSCAARAGGSYWRRIGGGSLLMSLTMHAVLVLVAIFVIHTFAAAKIAPPDPEFLSGGGGGGKNSVEAAASRRQMSVRQLMPRLVSGGANSEFSMPDVRSMTGTLAVSGVSVMTGGGMGGGEGGRRGKGTGGEFGDLMGKGIGPGTMPGLVAMFGKTLQARKLAVVLDVSGSMHRFLPAVVKEANKVSGGCPIVLFYGCGLREPQDRSVERQRPEPARGRDFREFWLRTFNDGAAPSSGNSALPNEDLFKAFNDRKDTWYFERQSTGYAWLALTSPKVRDADAIYWFADFQDQVDQPQLLAVQKLLEQRKQKLYVHASGGGNPSLEAVNVMLVQPTGGEILKVELTPATGK